jgi:AraC-like DNA-binding protein
MLALKPGEVSRTHFVATDPRLRSYITTYYFSDVQSRDGQPVADTLHPEWASFRFFREGELAFHFVGQSPQTIAPHVFHGPTSLGGMFTTQAISMGGFGVLPLGWHRFVDEAADEWANTVRPALSGRYRIPMEAIIRDLDESHSPEVVGQVFDYHLLAALENTPYHPDAEAKVRDAHAAIVDPSIETVAQLMDRLNLSSRTTIRLCRAVFGFPPKQLLRRQRFVRTLDVVMRDWARNWDEALDNQYYDMSHFHRDFRAVFGETPKQYQHMPHPVIWSAVEARTLAMGAPLQTLDSPRSA